MSFCTKCGHQRINDAAFCISCGNAFAKSQEGTPPPSPNYTGYYQQWVDPWKRTEFSEAFQNREKPKWNLYDKIYRTMGGMLFLTLAGIGLFIPCVILIANLVEDALSILVLLFLSMIVIAMAILTPTIVVHSRLLRSTVLKERVVLRNKVQFEVYIPRGGVAIKQSLTFELPDGTSKSLFLRSKHMRANGMYDLSIAGDCGTLVYQESNGKRRLIDFDNDNFIVDSKHSLYDKINHTQGGHVFSVLTLCFSSIALIMGIMLTFVVFLDESSHLNPYLFMVLLVFLPAALIGFICIPRLYVRLELKRKPEKQLQVKEKQERAKVLDKGQFGKHANDTSRHVLVFELPDKSRKSFQVRLGEIYRLVFVDDTGILTYKECKGETKLISFESDRLRGFL